MDNYEEFFLLAADGELDEVQQQALQRFIQDHPELESEYRETASLKLMPDEALVFEDKAALLKIAQSPKAIILSNRWRSLAAAASIGLLIWGGVRFSRSSQAVGSSAIASLLPAAPLSATKTQVRSAPPTIPAATSPVLTATTIQPQHHSKKRQPLRQAGLAPAILVTETPQLANLQSSQSSTPVPGDTPQPMLAMVGMAVNNGAQPATVNSTIKGGLHFSTENIAALQAFKAAAANTLDRINNSPYHIRDIAVNLRLGGRTLSINF